MFEECRTVEEIKKAYRQACLRLHPDNGGDEEAFKQMQQDFARMFDRVKNIHLNKDGQTYEKSGDNASTETAEEFMDIIDQLMQLDGIDVEICGSWIWVSGNTKLVKDALKDMGFKFSSNKKMWYYQRDGRRRYHKKAWTIDQIRNAYGSHRVRNNRSDRIDTDDGR